MMRVPGSNWWGWLLFIPVIGIVFAAMESLAAVLSVTLARSSCAIGLYWLIAIMFAIVLVDRAATGYRRYRARRRALASAPVVPRMVVATSALAPTEADAAGAQPSPPLALTWGRSWGSGLWLGTLTGVFVGNALLFWHQAATSPSIAQSSTVWGAALWRSLPLDPSVMIVMLFVGPPLVGMLLWVLLTPSHTVTVRDDGVEVRSAYGRGRVIRWDEARLFEEGGLSTLFVPDAQRFILYGSRGYAMWPSALSENERPKRMPRAEVGPRLVAMRVAISRRTGLMPRFL